MEIEIYRSSTKNSTSIDRHKEICRSCAKEEIGNGYDVEYDNYLCRYIHNEDGISYYSDGVTDEEIYCSICGGSFKGNEDEELLDSI